MEVFSVVNGQSASFFIFPHTPSPKAPLTAGDTKA